MVVVLSSLSSLAGCLGTILAVDAGVALVAYELDQLDTENEQSAVDDQYREEEVNKIWCVAGSAVSRVSKKFCEENIRGTVFADEQLARTAASKN